MLFNIIISNLVKYFRCPHIEYRENLKILNKVWKNRNPRLFDDCELMTKGSIDFTFVVPLYNSSNYIDELVLMLVNQNTVYSYEIILVDDGSKDDTLAKIKEYERKYSSLIHVIAKENGGISNARNSGLLASKGKYIGFMDHDDMVDENYVQELISAAYSNDADLVKCEIVVKNQGGSICENIQTVDEVISLSEADKLMAYDGYIWACAISRKLFEHLRFPDSYWYEDMITRFLIYPRCNKIVNTTKTKYVKYEHETNASKILWSSKNYKSLEQLYLLEHIFDCVPKFEIEKDLFIAKALLSEAGGTTEYRVNKLDSNIKKQVFIALRKIVLSNIDSDIYCKLSEDEKTVYEIFKHKRYLNWLLLKFL